MAVALGRGRHPLFRRSRPKPPVPTVQREVDEVFARLMEIADAIEKRAWRDDGG